jgi:hypothetical protein
MQTKREISITINTEALLSDAKTSLQAELDPLEGHSQLYFDAKW